MKQKFNPISDNFDFVGSASTDAAIRSIYYDATRMQGMAVTVPTAAAASLVVQSTISGLLSFGYNSVADANASLNMQIPKDYLTGGRFKILWNNSATSANSIVFAPIISVKSIGNSMITQTETLTPQVLASGTINLLQESGWFTPTTVFSVGQMILLRLTRAAVSNASDTDPATIYVNGVIFEYNY